MDGKYALSQAFDETKVLKWNAKIESLKCPVQ
jgi:hypothetical protein